MNYITLTIIAIAGIVLGIYFGRRSVRKSRGIVHGESCACGKKMKDCECANGRTCACGGAGGCGKKNESNDGLLLEQAKRKEESRQKILEFLQTNDPSRPDSRQGIHNNDVEKLAEVSDATAGRYLSELEREGVLIQHGDEGSGVFYTKK